MTKLVWDIDGVLRDLNKGLRLRYKLPYPIIWDWKDKDGFDVYDYVNKDLTVLEEAPPTKFVSVLQKYLGKDKYIELWSNQPDSWKPYTIRWLNKYFNKYDIKYFTPIEKEFNLLISEKNMLLVDDYPRFKNYDYVIVVDQPYNQHVICRGRLKHVRQLKDILKHFNIYCGELPNEKVGI